MTGKKSKNLDFEASMKQLETIVQRLEDEQVPLQEALDLFAEGKKLARACEKELEQAEQTLRRLLEDEDGNVSEQAFEVEGESAAEIGDAGDDDGENPVQSY